MKKGFTLVELLAVIIILALLSLIATTAVTKTVKDSRKNLYDDQILSIKAAAESWGADNLFKLPEINNCSYLTLKDLKEYGLIDSKISDPRNNTELSDDLKIKLSTKSNAKYGTSVTTYEVLDVTSDRKEEDITTILEDCLPIYSVEEQS